MIVFDHVSKVYPNGTVGLDDVCLRIDDGEFVAIIGRSGAGKVITKVNDDCFRRMVDSHKLDSFVTPKNIAADNIVTYVRAMQNSIDASGIESLHEIADGNAEVLEFSIKRPAEYLDIPLRSLSIRRDTLLAAIIRGNECIIPGGNDCVRMHDSVIAVTTRFGMQRFDDIFEE